MDCYYLDLLLCSHLVLDFDFGNLFYFSNLSARQNKILGHWVLFLRSDVLQDALFLLNLQNSYWVHKAKNLTSLLQAQCLFLETDVDRFFFKKKTFPNSSDLQWVQKIQFPETLEISNLWQKRNV